MAFAAVPKDHLAEVTATYDTGGKSFAKVFGG
jgi:hypothetical protein